MWRLAFTIPLTLVTLLLSTTNVASQSTGQRQVWHREFSIPLTHGEVGLSGSEFELRFNSLMQDDVINIQAADGGRTRTCFYALGVLRYNDPRARVMVEDARGVDAKSVANGPGWLSVQRLEDPKLRLFAHVEVPAGARVKVVVADRMVFRGSIVRGICLGNGAAWSPYKRSRQVLAHAMFRQVPDSPTETASFMSFGNLTLKQGERHIDLSLVPVRNEVDDEWVAVELYIAKEGRVIKAEPLIGSSDVVDMALRLVNDWRFENPITRKGGKLIKTVAVFISKDRNLSLSSPNQK